MAPSQASQALRDLYKQLLECIYPGISDFAMRALADQGLKLGAEPTGVSYEESTIADRPCLWAFPQGASKDHVLFYMHGGGFTLGTMDSYRKLFAHMTKSCNVIGVGIDYRQTPEHPYPAALDDCVNTYKALLGQGFAPDKIIFAGDSAGGGLCATVSVAAKQLGLPTPGACVSLSPWYDLTCSSQSYERNAENDVLNEKQFIEALAAKYTAGKVSPEDPLVSPLFADLKGLPPTWISIPEFDSIADDGRRFAEKAKKAGVEVVVEVHEGQQHVFEFMAGRAPEADGSIQRIGEWVRKRIRC